LGPNPITRPSSTTVIVSGSKPIVSASASSLGENSCSTTSPTASPIIAGSTFCKPFAVSGGKPGQRTSRMSGR
jgi:hypothetical protein